MKIIVSAILSITLGIELQSPTAKPSFQLPLNRAQIPAFLIIDTKEKRQINVFAGDEETIGLDLQTGKFRDAKFYGNCVPGKLSPNLVWVTK